MMKTKLILVGLLALAGTVQAEIINFSFNTTQGGGNDVVMDGVAYNGANAPAAYTGTTWTELGYVPVASPAGLTDSDGNGSAMSVQFTGTGAMWSIPGLTDADGGALASYSYSTTSMTISGGTGLYDIYILTQDSTPNATSFTIGADTQTTIVGSATPYAEGVNYVKFSSVDVAGGTTVAINQGPINGFQMVAVPEPATLGLVAMFGGAVLFIRRRLSI